MEMIAQIVQEETIANNGLTEKPIGEENIRKHNEFNIAKNFKCSRFKYF